MKKMNFGTHKFREWNKEVLVMVKEGCDSERGGLY